jgi:predicted dehydrogenase
VNRIEPRESVNIAATNRTTRRTFLTHAAASIAAAMPIQVSLAAEASGDWRAKPDDGVVKMAIVGTGQISHRYLKQAAGSPRARFVATCARTLESAKTRALEYGITDWFDDYEAMYDKAKPDAVIIATPSSVHAAPAIAALERRIHVLCEKPMATRFEDCEAMVAAAQKNDAVFLAMPFNATPPFLTALDYLNEATLGVFTGAEAQLNISGHSRPNWYYERDVAGGVMLDTMVYPVARLIDMLGPAKRVTGFVSTLIPHRMVGDKTVESNIDDNVSLVVEWDGGQQGLFRALWGTSMFRGDTFIYGRHGTLLTSVFGGEVVVHSPERPIDGAEPMAWHGQKDCYRPRLKSLPNITGDGHIDHFVDCIQKLAQPTCSGLQRLHVHEILFRGYEAARSGRTQELKSTFTPWHKIDPAFHDTRSRPI